MDENTKFRINQHELLLIVVVFLWGTNYPIAKFGISELGGFVFNSIRFITASIILAVPFFFKVKWKTIERADRGRLFHVGIISSVIYQILFIVGLSLTTAGNAAIILATSPLWTIILNSYIHKEKIQYSVWFGMGLSIAGIFLIIIGSGEKLEIGGKDIFGDIITLAAAVFWALNTNLQKPLLKKYSAIQITFVQFLIGAIGLTLVAVPSALKLNWSSVPFSYYLSAVVSGSLAIALANIIWSYGIQKLGPGRTANYGNLVPVVALIASYFAGRD
jgi:drug/metabolite transporter (DMT)-like permease